MLVTGAVNASNPMAGLLVISNETETLHLIPRACHEAIASGARQPSLGARSAGGWAESTEGLKPVAHAWAWNVKVWPSPRLKGNELLLYRKWRKIRFVHRGVVRQMICGDRRSVPESELSSLSVASEHATTGARPEIETNENKRQTATIKKCSNVERVLQK